VVNGIRSCTKPPIAQRIKVAIKIALNAAP